MNPINQQNYYEEAGKLMSDLFSIGNSLKGTGVDITPIVNIMQHTYVNYILPKELEDAGVEYEIEEEL